MAGAKLTAARFENDDTTAEVLEKFKSVESCGVDWDVYDFGVTRIEATVKANGSYDAYDRIGKHLGQRLALYGADLYQPISGKIYEVEWLPGDRIRYVAYGPNWDCERSYIVKRFASTDTIGATIAYIASKIPTANGDTSNITANTTTLDGWNPAFPQGSYPSEAIRELIAMSDSTSSLWDFRLIDEPLSGTSLRQFVPHYTKRTSAEAADWVIKREDLASGGLRFSRNIADFANIVRVWYGLIEGTSTAVTATTMTDSGATFISDGVKPGDTLTNLTKGGRTKIVTVNSQTQITHEGWRAKVRGTVTSGTTTTLVDNDADFINDGAQAGDTLVNIVDSQLVATDGIGTITSRTATTLTIAGAMSGGKTNDAAERYEIYGNMVSGDDYSISTEAQTKYKESQIDKGDLWDKEIAIFERNMNAAQAAQYADALVTVTAQQVQSFIISAPYITDGNGARHPLWDVIAYGGGYIQISDLYPAAAQFSNVLNSLTTFWITGMSYDYKTNSLTVDVDNLSRRLDARLRRDGILRVPQVRRY